MTTLLLLMPLALGATACSGATEPTPSAPAPSAPLEPLGPTTSGGLLEMPGSGFTVDIPTEWSVEVAEPVRDLAQAQPGDAWEALRAYAPGRRLTCSVYVAVTMLDTTDWDVEVAPGLGDPRWTGSDTGPVLEVPDPEARVEDRSGDYGFGSAGHAVDGSVADHHVVRAIICAGDGEKTFDGIFGSLMLLPVE